MKVYLVQLFLLQLRIVYSSGVKKEKEKKECFGCRFDVSMMTLSPFEEGGGSSVSTSVQLVLKQKFF